MQAGAPQGEPSVGQGQLHPNRLGDDPGLHVHHLQHRVLAHPPLRRPQDQQLLHPLGRHEHQCRMYLFPDKATLIFFTIFLMLNFLIPITLNIVIEGVKTFSGIFLTFDRKLYDPTIKKKCGVLSTSII